MALIIEIGGPDKRAAPVIIRTALGLASGREKEGGRGTGDLQNHPFMSPPIVQLVTQHRWEFCSWEDSHSQGVPSSPLHSCRGRCCGQLHRDRDLLKSRFPWLKYLLKTQGKVQLCFDIKILPRFGFHIFFRMLPCMELVALMISCSSPCLPHNLSAHWPCLLSFIHLKGPPCISAF